MDADGLTVRFGESTKKEMPFMLGYRPAIVLKSSKPNIETEHGETFTLNHVFAVGSRALEVKNCSAVTLHDNRFVD